MLLSAELIEINREPHMLVSGLDITQRKQAEAELLRTLAREKELGQLRSKFVSMVSHEFRTPLAIIQSSAEMPTMVQADGRLLRHIFTNLLHNAVKYSDAGRVVQFEIVCPGADIVSGGDLR
jgi:signal transduction histidine kinase